MKSIVELLNELKVMDELQLAERFQLSSLDVAYHRRLDFDNWLRRCVEPGRRFAGLEDAWNAYEKSFG
jgi:hypothetical protein